MSEIKLDQFKLKSAFVNGPGSLKPDTRVRIEITARVGTVGFGRDPKSGVGIRTHNLEVEEGVVTEVVTDDTLRMFTS